MDKGFSSEKISLGVKAFPLDQVSHTTRMVIHRFGSDADFEKAEPYLGLVAQACLDETEDPLLKEIEGFLQSLSIKTGYNERNNLLLNTGINQIWTDFASATLVAYPFSNANTRIGVGDSTTAAVATQTGLQATTNKTFQQLTANYPTVGVNQQYVAQAVFSGTAANYAWNEFIIDNGVTNISPVALNRLVSAQGTKVSGQIWTVTMSVTLS